MGSGTEMLLDTDRAKNIDLIGEKVSIFCRTHIAVGHRIQGGRPGPLWLKYAVDDRWELNGVSSGGRREMNGGMWVVK